MAKKTSAGILLYRIRAQGLEVFLVHPGGPFWKRKDLGAWSIPKGEFTEGEDALEAAKREFHEETGSRVAGPYVALKPLTQRSGKLVYVWAAEGDIDASSLTSNTFSMEWPARSGIYRDFPEVDRGEWFPVAAAYDKLLAGQCGFLDELQSRLELAADGLASSGS